MVVRFGENDAVTRTHTVFLMGVGVGCSRFKLYQTMFDLLLKARAIRIRTPFPSTWRCFLVRGTSLLYSIEYSVLN